MFFPFLANDCDLFLHIMLALRYYYSMMLRGDQSLLRGRDYSTETTSCWQLYLVLSTTVDQTVNTVLVQLGTLSTWTRPLTMRYCCQRLQTDRNTPSRFKINFFKYNGFFRYDGFITDFAVFTGFRHFWGRKKLGCHHN